MRLLLDTATLVFAVEAPNRLSRRGFAALKNDGNDLELSAVSITEIAIKTALGKLGFTDATLRQALEDLRIRVLSYTAAHALKLFDLPLHHGDPFDRQIIAQALVEEIPVVTPDKTFRLYGGLRVFW